MRQDIVLETIEQRGPVKRLIRQVLMHSASERHRDEIQRRLQQAGAQGWRLGAGAGLPIGGAGAAGEAWAMLGLEADGLEEQPSILVENDVTIKMPRESRLSA